MRILLLLSLILTSSYSLAWECYTYDKYSQPIEKHLEMASDVLVGTVIEGKFEEPSGPESDVKLKLKINLAIKGSKAKEIEISTSSHLPNPKFYIGGNYIIFFYGSRKIDFCSMVLELWAPISSQEELTEYSKRKDIEGIERVVAVANYLKENP